MSQSKTKCNLKINSNSYAFLVNRYIKYLNRSKSVNNKKYKPNIPNQSYHFLHVNDNFEEYLKKYIPSEIEQLIKFKKDNSDRKLKCGVLVVVNFSQFPKIIMYSKCIITIGGFSLDCLKKDVDTEEEIYYFEQIHTLFSTFDTTPLNRRKLLLFQYNDLHKLCVLFNTKKKKFVQQENAYNYVDKNVQDVNIIIIVPRNIKSKIGIDIIVNFVKNVCNK